MRNLRYGLMAVVVVGWTWHAFPLGGAQAEASALGADACLELFVHDEQGQPVPGARVDYSFWLVDRQHTVSSSATTDADGRCLAKGRCSADVHVSVSCDGYYGSRVERYMRDFAQGAVVVGGKWQPYGARLPILLRKRMDPVSLERHYVHHGSIPATNVWIGFDMAAERFVAPYGAGVIADFEILFTWDGGARRNYRGAELSLRFPPPSGGYWFDKVIESEFKGVRFADTNATYRTGFVFFERKVGMEWKETLFPQERELVVRTRCTENEDGTLKEASYGMVSIIKFGWGNGGKGDFRIGYVRNPKPNDPNLEPKR